MTDYAIIKTGGKQYRVRPGDTLQVEKLGGAVGDAVTLSDVLLLSVDGKVAVGRPTVENASVLAEISGQGRGEKLTVFKYKAKTRYRRKNGHRQSLTTLLVKSFGTEAPKPAGRRTRTARATKAAADGPEAAKPAKGAAKRPAGKAPTARRPATTRKPATRGKAES